eukprot:GHVS01078292.1.p1 GENE.GHVS01078292.1~~GHVS01078292.1.p1  ORF type:complete len:202 (-),score=55.42 GHVS01078292.1:527-1132(-)
MSSFMGMPSGRSLLLCAAVAALCVSLASAAADKKRTLADANKLLNNIKGTVITADKDWTPATIKELSEEWAKATSGSFGVSSPVMYEKNNKIIVVRMELKNREEKRAPTDDEVAYIKDQSKFFDEAWVKKVKEFKGKDGLKVTEVAVKQEMKKYGVDSNINEKMTQDFYGKLPEEASSAWGLAVNKMVCLVVVVGTFLAAC